MPASPGRGRLHDLFVAVEAVTPGEFKRKGAGIRIDYGFHQTPFGECLLAATERGICTLLFVDDETRDANMAAFLARWQGAAIVENDAATRPLLDTVFPTEPTSGRRKIDLFVQGTNFQLKVWNALLQMPAGTVATYGDLAERIGSPTAARAVGSAVGANWIGYVIPCHRVIRSGGTVREYRWGSTRKKAILGWEAARGQRQIVNN